MRTSSSNKHVAVVGAGPKLGLDDGHNGNGTCQFLMALTRDAAVPVTLRPYLPRSGRRSDSL